MKANTMPSPKTSGCRYRSRIDKGIHKISVRARDTKDFTGAMIQLNKLALKVEILIANEGLDLKDSLKTIYNQRMMMWNLGKQQ